MDAPTPLARLIETKLRAAGRLNDDADLHAWIRFHRPDDGRKTSWDDIAVDLRMVTGEKVTGPTVAAWFPDLTGSKAADDGQEASP